MEKPLEKSDMPALTGKEAADLERAGIDIAKASPLLMYVLEANRDKEKQPQASPVSDMRTPVLPPLTREEIAKRDFEEAMLETELSACWHGEEFDEQRAEDLLRAYAIIILELYLKAYRAHLSFRPAWTPQIVSASIQRIEKCFGKQSWDPADKYRRILIDTLLSHLCQRHNWIWMEVYRGQPITETLELIPTAHALLVPEAPQSIFPPVMNQTEVESRAKMLSDYKQAAGNPSNRKIYTAQNSKINKPEFYQWINGVLPPNSRTTKQFEAFLKSRRKPIPRKPTIGA